MVVLNTNKKHKADSFTTKKNKEIGGVRIRKSG
jgi:hypothetical protein